MERLEPAIKPILFNTEMVRAILEGRKTQTRRIVKLPEGINPHRAEPSLWYENDLGMWDFAYGKGENGAILDLFHPVKAPCSVNDVLWVREAWVNLPVSPGGHTRLMRGRYYYKADMPDIRPEGWRGNWRPSIHMPKEAARIFLRVKDVRAERLRSISSSDAMDEGFSDWNDFVRVWNKTVVKGANHRLYNWEANPWVWVITFERCERPEGFP